MIGSCHAFLWFLVNRSVGLTRLAFVTQAVGVAFDVDDGGAVKEAVEHGAGHGGVITKDLSPITEGFVAGEDDGGLVLVALTDHLEQEAGLHVIELEIADFIDDEQFGASEVVQLAVETVFIDRFA